MVAPLRGAFLEEGQVRGTKVSGLRQCKEVYQGMNEEEMRAAQGLVDFVAASPSAFHTAATVRARLDGAGFERLREGDSWAGRIAPGGSYYVTRNNSSVVAFKVGQELDGPEGGYHFQLAAAHADSPTLRIKSVPELEGPGEYLRLETEVYGGAITRSWLDRPLGLAGRVMVRDGGRVESRLVNIQRPVIVVPSVAIHLSHDDPAELDRARDLVALFSAGELTRGSFNAMIAEAAGCDPADVLAHDLFAVNLDAPCIWGQASEFIGSGHLDDLQSAYVALEGFVRAANPRAVTVYACFDNEEVGSGTRQGAKSTFLADVLTRANAALGRTPEDFARALDRSLMLSADNAHALHPNHPEKTDPAEYCQFNHGIVLKEAANQRYAADAFARAALVAVLDAAGVPYQAYANRSDIKGGTTLGNLSTAQLSVATVDVGMPQLAMHSAWEVAGAKDCELGIRAFTAFFAADLRLDGADSIELG